MTRPDDFSEERLIELVAAFGADPRAWPVKLGDATIARLSSPPPALAKALAEAAELDTGLAGLPRVEPPTRLFADILDAAPQANVDKPMAWRRIVAGWGARLAAGAAALAMGLSLGLGTAAASAPASDPFADLESVIADYEAFGRAGGMEDR
ncbi:MAG: hypothetical protein AAGH87_10435 [Pseudomonadota bacterium]